VVGRSDFVSQIVTSLSQCYRYECLFGVAPFACDNEETLIAKIVSPTPITLRERVPPLTADCVSLLSGLLQRDPRDRLTFDAFFQHTFVDVFSVPSAQSLTIAHDLRRRAETCNDAAQAVRIYTKVRVL
jgi:serine/threonine protein kinase